MNPLDQAALDALFFNARTHNAWRDTPVSNETLVQLHDTMKWAPTSANCSPLRVLFIQSHEAKEKLRPVLDAGNVEKTMSAPVTALLSMDMHFYDHLPQLFPHADAKSWFVGNEPKIEFTAFLNASLQGGYFILAARALGLDCGPMSGFNRDAADEAFLAGTPHKSLFLCNLGHGDASKLYPRSPRFAFEEACKIL